MGQTYSQLSFEERSVISHLHADGLSLREIGSEIGRSASTISRELKRNSKRTKHWPGGYHAERADGLAARRRRWDCRFKLARQPTLRSHVQKHLAMGWSPEQIVGRLALEDSSMQISHESIYRYIYHRVEQKDYDWHRHLRRRKFHRGKHVRGGKSSVETSKNRISIHARPKMIAERKSFGHWEADLMSFQHNKQNILVASERKSRKIFAHKLPNKKSKTVRKRLRDSLKKLPPSLRRTITYDNGTEFAQHHELNVDCNMKSYFCDTHSPWQKGGVENGIGRLRQDLPEGTNLNGVTPQKLDQIVRRKNNTPRKCLGFLTPNEVWAKAIISSTVALQP